VTDEFSELFHKHQALSKKAFRVERVNEEVLARELAEITTLREDSYQLRLGKVRLEKRVDFLKGLLKEKQDKLGVLKK